MLDRMDEHLASNRALWDEWADINARSEMYALELDGTMPLMYSLKATKPA